MESQQRHANSPSQKIDPRERIIWDRPDVLVDLLEGLRQSAAGELVDLDLDLAAGDESAPTQEPRG